jgi:hypothetical protein
VKLAISTILLTACLIPADPNVQRAGGWKARLDLYPDSVTIHPGDSVQYHARFIKPNGDTIPNDTLMFFYVGGGLVYPNNWYVASDTLGQFRIFAQIRVENDHGEGHEYPPADDAIIVIE